jgi:hypothetical protein
MLAGVSEGRAVSIISVEDEDEMSLSLHPHFSTIALLYTLTAETLVNIYTKLRCGTSQNTIKCQQLYNSVITTAFIIFTVQNGMQQLNLSSKITKLRGLSPQANYTDRATADCRRS